jgi:magnesium-transporting ATPase (P-type)
MTLEVLMSTRLMAASLQDDAGSTLRDPGSSWYACEAGDVLHALGSVVHGLGQAEASRRLKTYGPNLLTEAPPPGLLVRLARQFNNLLLWVNMVSSVVLAMVLAFEPTEADVMRRPPGPADEPLLSRFLVWRIAFVSALFLTGIFGIYEWALLLGASVDAARTVAVNTLVCMEVFYLFSVRYLKARSFTWQGVRGTPRLLAAVAGVFALQLFFTYAPVMQQLFRTEALPLVWGPRVIAVGIVLLAILEIEKAVLRRVRTAA